MSSLRSFILTRIALFVPLLWFLLSAVFVLLRILPGDPIKALNPNMPPHQVAIVRAQFGLDKSISEQYFLFLKQAIRFDFGDSIYTNADVGDELKLYWGPTFTLALFSMLIGVPLGIYLGGVAGANRGKEKDQIVRILTIGIYASPVFLVGILLQITFGEGGTFQILPPLGILSPGLTDQFTHYTEVWLVDSLLSGKLGITLDILIHLILPSLTLGMLIASSIARQVRTNMIYELEQEYVQFARARGISEKTVVKKYALKNAVIPVVGLIGLQFALLLSGAILTETVFNIPGLGRYLFLAIINRDFPAVQGAFVVFMFIVSIVSLISDVLHAILDPRIKF